ncbi:MAG: hypothetical protein U0359_11520 [Byssovorax sp.]
MLAVAILLSLSLPARLCLADGTPTLRYDAPFRCITNPKGEVVRVQCDDKAPSPTCLVAPNVTSAGAELKEARDCPTVESNVAYARLVDSGAKIVPALADVPPGYARSESGRAFQVKFDLLNRIYLGLSWVPTFEHKSVEDPTPPGFPFGRGQAETGFHISVLSPKGRSRHDFRVLEGTATFKDLELRGLLFAYDYQHLHRRPAFYVSTFFGKPRLYEVTPALGWGVRVLNINDRPPSFRNTLDAEILETHVSWNPWQSNDLYSHLRVEAGIDVGKYWENRTDLGAGLGTGSWYAGFTSAVKTRFSLGEGGLHYFFADVTYLRPTMFQGQFVGQSVNRINATFAYEGILLAINDQPLSVRIAAQGGTHDDPGEGVRNVELRLTAGLRFSFWAPPRVFEPLPDLEDP